MEKEDMENLVMLPKGTIVKLFGFPCELIQDTEVISTSVKKIGVQNMNRESQFTVKRPSVTSTDCQESR